jgi:prolyl oligopeptidase
VLLTAGLDDPRADAWQAAKLAARLQAANSGNRPVLMKVLGGAASGPTLSRGEREEELADTYAFILEAFR